MVYTIGEVLNRLRDEFSDVTISRIRQFETRGLISPDRTESGYRKFTDRDIDRVRYVLTALRDRQISLEVIGRELDRIDQGLAPTAPPESGSAASAGADDPRRGGGGPEPTPPAGPADPAGPLQLQLDGAESFSGAHESSDPPNPTTMEPPLSDDARPDDRPSDAADPATSATAPPPGDSADDHDHIIGPFVDEVGDLRLTDSELADATGLTVDDVKQLREHGILGREALFDAGDVKLATVAAQLLAAGLEPRHLRMFRQFAQREAGLLEQLLLPHLRQRNPDSRDRALAMSQRLGDLGAEIQRRLLEEELEAVLRAWR